MADNENVQPSTSAEEAATAQLLATFVAAVKQNADQASADQKQTATALSDAQAKLAEVTAIATLAMAAKTAIEDLQAVIATKSDHIQKAQEHADKVRGELDRVLTAATQQGTEAEGLKARAQSATDSATALLAEIRTTKGAIDTDAAAVIAARDASKESASQSKDLADKADAIKASLADYESRLAALEEESKVQLADFELV